jgi:hypothetical protein
MRMTLLLSLALALSFSLAACLPAPAAEQLQEQAAAPPTEPPPRTPQETTPPAPTRTPLAAPSATQPQLQLSSYRHPEGFWTLRYPADLLHVEVLSAGQVRFASPDGNALLLIDTYLSPPGSYGNSGENLRNRAREMLPLLLMQGDVLQSENSEGRGPWDTGVSFVASEGLRGEAFYQQPPLVEGRPFRAYGVLLAAAPDSPLLPALEAMRDSLRTIDTAAPAEAQVGRDGHIIFLAEDGMRLQRMRPDGSAVETIATIALEAPAFVADLLPSPSGDALLYSLALPQTGGPYGYTLLRDGQATPFEQAFLSPQWSPDGTRFVATAFEGLGGPIGQVILYELASDERTTLAARGTASWFPDGERLLIVEGTAISVYDLRSATQTSVVRLPSEGEDAWEIRDARALPNGETIVFYGAPRRDIGLTGAGLRWWWLPRGDGEPQPFGVGAGGTWTAGVQASPAGDYLGFGEAVPMGACGSGYVLEITPSVVRRGGAALRPPLPLPGEGFDRQWLSGWSWTSPEHLVYSLRDIRCTPDGPERGPATIYGWSIAAIDGTRADPVQLAQGSFPTWIAH